MFSQVEDEDLEAAICKYVPYKRVSSENSKTCRCANVHGVIIHTRTLYK